MCACVCRERERQHNGVRRRACLLDLFKKRIIPHC